MRFAERCSWSRNGPKKRNGGLPCDRRIGRRELFQEPGNRSRWWPSSRSTSLVCGPFWRVAGDLELDLVAFDRAFVLLHHRVAVEFALHFEGNFVAVHLAVRDFASGAEDCRRRGPCREPGRSSLLPVLLEGDGYRTAGIAAAAGLFIGPLAADIGGKCADRQDKQNRRYKKQLFGHSVRLGVAQLPDVTALGALPAEFRTIILSSSEADGHVILNELALDEARRIALAAQGFAQARGRPVRRPGTSRDTIRSLGLVQIDCVNVLVPAHYQVLFSRLGPVRPRRLRPASRTAAANSPSNGRTKRPSSRSRRGRCCGIG